MRVETTARVIVAESKNLPKSANRPRSGGGNGRDQ